MPAHLSASELGKKQVLAGRGRTPIKVLDALAAQRARRGAAPPHLTTVRQALKGMTFRRGAREARGRKSKLTKKATRRLNCALHPIPVPDGKLVCQFQSH